MADISTAVSMARVPILGEDGRISDDYIPAAIGENVTKAEAAATRAETAATGAEGSASAASQSSAQAAGSASAASASASQAQQSATAAGSSATSAQSAKTAAEAAQSAAAGSARDARQSATAAAQSAASVADKFITSARATTLEPGSQATASVADQVLTIGVPKGEKGDPGRTPQRGVDYWTAEDVEAVVEDAKAQAVAELAEIGNVPKRTVTDLVAHGEDAYVQKPIEVRVKGRTVKNLWPEIAGTQDGLTIATDETGLITVSGTATAAGHIRAMVSGLAENKDVSAVKSGGTMLVQLQAWNAGAYVRDVMTVNTSASTANTGTGFDTILARISYTNGETYNASFRVMLVEGSEAPDCFTPPASITSVQAGNLVTSGKNLLARMGPKLPYTIAGITFSDNGDGGIRVSGTATSSAYYNFFNDTAAQAVRITPGEYTASSIGVDSGTNLTVEYYDGEIGAGRTSWLATNLTGVSNTGSVDRPVYLRPFLSVANGKTVDTVVYPQLELGSTATAYEPPNVTTTPLPEVELRSLPDGTCDELVIKADGTATVERRTQLSGDEVTALPEPTTEPQSPVSLPVLPAPTFNAYHDSQVPSDTSVEYARDINIVIDNLAKQIAGTAATVAINEATR